MQKRELEEKSKILNANKPFLIFMSVIFAVYSITLVFPFLWLIFNSLKGKFEFMDNPMAMPQALQWKNYITMFVEFDLGTMFLNTILMSTIIPTVQLFITAGVAYVCAKFKSITGKVCYFCAMVQIYVTISGTLPTTYKLMADTGLLDSLFGLVFMGSGGLNFSFLLIVAIFQNISNDYKEAAEIDGAGNWRIFLQIYFPQVFSIIIAHWLLAFIGQWNNYVAPKLFWPSAFTLATGIQDLSNRVASGVFAMEYPKLFAAMIITIIPVLVLFMRFVFSAIFIIFIALTWAGIKSVLSGFAKVLSTFAYGSKNLVFMRVMILITSSCWLIYNLLVKSYAGVLSESITITSIVISMFRFKPKKTDNTAEQAAILIETEISEAENAGADCDKPDETTVSQNEITREADGQDGEAVTE